MTDNKRDIYKTSDVGLAAFLCTQGFVFLGAVKYPDSERMNFCFIAKDTNDEVVNAYISGTTRVSPRHYYSKVQLIKRSLRTPVEAEEELPE